MSRSATSLIDCAQPTLYRQPDVGFTLIELLIVIAIVGMLVSYVGPRYFAQLGKSEVTITRTQIEAFVRALDAFRLDVGRYPTNAEGLTALRNKPDTAPKWNGPYINKNIPHDPWGQMYIYKTNDNQGDFEVKSYGRDGRSGGTGEDADISS